MRSSTPSFAELIETERLATAWVAAGGRCEAIAEIPVGARAPGARFPVLAFEIGSRDPRAPVLGLFGGVHGLERIGSQVVIAYLASFLGLAQWDESLQWLLERTRLIAVPIVNPVGMYLHRRANPRGVDLMRNSPTEARDATWLLGGHRISPRLPWYRGTEGELEAESAALCRFVEERSFASRFALWVDVHSGFGRIDRLWFPYARTREPFPWLAEVVALKGLLDQAYPHHVYRLEPQALNYVTHGDLWDYLFDRHARERTAGEGLVLPLTLEMGSWAWVRKNPWQMFSYAGPFNPIKPHRERRVLRRHLGLMDFLLRAAGSHRRWLPTVDRAALERQAHSLWY
jgi:hypothetical protein